MLSLKAIKTLGLFFVPFILLTCSQNEKNNGTYQNRLASANSPYLKEHADNPVDWYEWGAEALEKAKKENKPLIISVGYASCHWCHVMEKESFMDTAVARFMNENFVSIKVDREERPDIDQIYMNAAQLISGNGGWPLNAFALPDGKPFYVATYFPKEQWLNVLSQVQIAFKKDQGTVVRQAEALTKEINAFEIVTPPGNGQRNINQKDYKEIFSKMRSAIDYQSGGLQGSPKFPMPVVWEYLLQEHYLTGNKKALEAVTTTLNEMSKGGIYDQLAGGFARYSTDSIWKAPHFEKMLYDNGQLVSLYAHAFQQTRDSSYAGIVHQTLNFVALELTSPEGGFYSSLNADSEGEEGKFYVWTKDEIGRILNSPQNGQQKNAELLMAYYGVSDTGNWEDQKNILRREDTDDDFSRTHVMPVGEWNKILTESNRKLLVERNKRIHPSLDSKILTSWNALMLDGYVDAYFATGRKQYLEAAVRNATFLEKNMVREGGRLWRNYHKTKPSIDGFLDDYAFLAKSFIHLYEATFDIHWLEQARSTTDYAVSHFRNEKNGLFYYTSDESEYLVARKMELTDNVIPSSNSILAEVLFRLGEYYDVDSYREMTRSMLNQVANDVTTNGQYYSHWASLMGLIAFQPYEVAVVGDDASSVSAELRNHYLPTTIFMGGDQENLPLLANKVVKNKTIIYVCRDKVCKLPVFEVEKALEQLK